MIARDGDHLTMLTVFEQWKETEFSSSWCLENFIQVRSMKRARDIKDQLVELCKRVEIDYADESLSVVDDDSYSNVRRAIASGYFYHAAKLSEKSGTYKPLKGAATATAVHVHPSSSLQDCLPKWVIYSELVFTSKEYMRELIEIEPKWLLELAPHYFKHSDIFGEERKQKTLKMPPRAATK